MSKAVLGRAFEPFFTTKEAATCTVLLVEDDELVRENTARMLSRAGYEIVQAANGEEAMEKIRGEKQIDLVFTDLVMPGKLNGQRLAEEL